MFGLMVGFNFNSTTRKKKKKKKEKYQGESNSLSHSFMGPNVLHIFTPIVCYLHFPHDMTEEDVS